MKMMMIAALVAAQVSVVASPAQAAERTGGDLVTQQPGASAGARLGEDVELTLRDGQTPEPRIDTASESPRAATAQEAEPRKKRKSTGDKVLTGAAVILGVGALAVGGLLVALFAG